MTKHRVLIVGTGSIGERHLRCFRATGRADLSICETNEQLRKTILDRYPGTRGYATYEEAIADRAAGHDIVVVATPAHLHIPMARRAVEEGKNVFIEKPLSTSQEGIAELADLIQRKGVVAAVAFTYRSHPSLREMKQAIAAGRFGRPVQAIAVWGQHFPKYRPAYRSTYYTSRATGGGLIQDLMPHAINAVEFLVGPTDRIMADAAHQVLEGVTVEDTTHVIARNGGVLTCYCLNQHQAPNENSLVIVCEKGTVKFELQNARWLSMVEPGGDWKLESTFSLERDDIFISQANIYMDAVEGKGPVACTLADGWQTLKACLAVLKTADNPTWQMIQ